MSENEAQPRRGDRTNAVGRPTPELIAKVSAILRTGAYLDTAAEAAGIDVDTFAQWLTKGAKQRSGPYRDLHAAVQRARAEGEATHVALIAQSARDNWQAAAWLLERQYPDRWARASQRGEGAPRQHAPSAGADAFAEVDELARHRKTHGR
jgi:hypothetical protein